MNNTQPHTLRALRLTPLRDTEKSAHARTARPAMPPPLGLRDSARERPLNIEPRRGRRFTWIHGAFICGLAAIVCVLLYPVLFPSARVSVVPRTSTLSFSAARLIASKDGAHGVTYSLVPVVVSNTAAIAATQKKQTRTKAHGSITISNTVIDAPQRLIKNTRFESASGSIYRIRESIVVPAVRTVDGKKVPGTLEVTVYADDVGSSYNLAKGHLSIPGLRPKSELYAGITAEVHMAISGGSVGETFAISDSERADAYKKIDAQLLESAQAKAHEGLPPETLVLRGAEEISYRDLPDTEEGTNVIVGRELTYTQMRFSHIDFAEYIHSQSSINDLPDSAAHITNVANISVTLAPTTKKSSVFSDEALTFSIAGSPTLEWVVDEAALKHALAGVERARIPEILKANQTIGSGTQVDIMPFWNNVMPSEGRITVVVSSVQKNEKK
jgi:hypothetical protein